MNDWFHKLTGFSEENPDQVRGNFTLSDDKMTSKVNNKTYQCGHLEVLSLEDLRNRKQQGENTPLKISEEIGDIQQFHVIPDNQDALFQAASQFNLLEMVNPEVSPEDGIGRYQFDKTQGPACAIACGAGTIYRNYFVPIGNQLGQRTTKQIDCLDEIGQYLGNDDEVLWQMKNGYALCTQSGLQQITNKIKGLNNAEYKALKGKLKVGIQWNTQVTIADQFLTVSQVYCSALPVAYSWLDANEWETFARLILSATYEATFLTALENYQKTGNNKVYLTLVGGGAFGNRPKWLVDAITENLSAFSQSNLDVVFVSYGGRDPIVKTIIDQYNTL